VLFLEYSVTILSLIGLETLIKTDIQNSMNFLTTLY